MSQKEYFGGLTAEDRQMLTMRVLKWLILIGLVLLAFGTGRETAAWPAKPLPPICPRYAFYEVMTTQGAALLIDGPNLEKLVATIEGLSNGTCRIDANKQAM